MPDSDSLGILSLRARFSNESVLMDVLLNVYLSTNESYYERMGSGGVITYELKTDTGRAIKDPSMAQIEAAIRVLDDADGKFAILGKSKLEYIQIAGNATEGYSLEYQKAVGGAYCHYEAAEKCYDIDKAITAFQKYRNSNKQWEVLFDWRKSRTQPIKRKALTPLHLISLISFVLAGSMLVYSIYQTRFQNESPTENIFGVKWLYYLTALFVLMAIGFAPNLQNWDNLTSDSKVRAAAVFVLAVFMLLMSLLTLLGIGNLAN